MAKVCYLMLRLIIRIKEIPATPRKQVLCVDKVYSTYIFYLSAKTLKNMHSDSRCLFVDVDAEISATPRQTAWTVPENCFLCDRKRYYSLGGIKSKELMEKISFISNEKFELFCKCKHGQDLGICRPCVIKVNSTYMFAKTVLPVNSPQSNESVNIISVCDEVHVTIEKVPCLKVDEHTYCQTDTGADDCIYIGDLGTSRKKVPQHCFSCDRKRYYSLGGVKSKDLMEKLSFICNEDFELFCEGKDLGICRPCVAKVNYKYLFTKTLREKIHWDNDCSHRDIPMTIGPRTPKFKPATTARVKKRKKTRRTLPINSSQSSESVDITNVCDEVTTENVPYVKVEVEDEHTEYQTGPGSSACVRERAHRVSVTDVQIKCEKDITSLLTVKKFKKCSLEEKEDTNDPVVNRIVDRIVANQVALKGIGIGYSTLASKNAPLGSALSRYRSVTSLAEYRDHLLDEVLLEMSESHEKEENSTASDEVQMSHPHVDGDVDDQTGLQGVTAQNAAALGLDPNMQYQFRADTGQGPVTYRVVQVATQDGTEAQAQVVAAGIPAGAQTIVQNPFNGSSPTPDSQPDTRFTYFPTVSGGAGDVGTTQAEVTNAALAGQAGNWQQDSSVPQGQFYVMMSPQDVLQGQRNIAPRTGFTPKIEGGRTGRDDRRRATHNEVERRRRDKINNWIVQLSKLVPDCSNEHTKAGQLGSKGGILSKACDYINDLKMANSRLNDSLKETERLSVDNELLRQQVEELKNENVILRTTLQQHGIVGQDTSGGQT